MKLVDLLRTLRGAFAHRLRAALTILGVAIGAGSIVFLASLLYGGGQFLLDANQEATEVGMIAIESADPPPSMQERTTHELSREDAKSLGEAPLLGNMAVGAENSFDLTARFRAQRKRVAVVSSASNILSVYRLAIGEGRFLDETDGRESRRVCVVGREVYEELLNSAPLSDLKIDLDGELFSVIGVLQKKPMLGATDSTGIWDRKVLIPEQTYDALYNSAHAVRRVYLRPRGDAVVEQPRLLTRAIARTLLLRRHLGVLNFEFAKDRGEGEEKLIGVIIHILLLGSGALALLAAGINIMNVMLVTVSERTREIGLRRALGATAASIRKQFLLEAGLLSLLGSLAGVVVGALFAWGAAKLASSVIGPWKLGFPVWSFATGIGMALFLGICFGWSPARRASRILPVEALRAE